MPAATEAALPPDDPPHARSRSQGLWAAPCTEFSVDDPIANSSMLVRPMMIAPAACSFSTTHESYGETYPSRIRDEHVVGSPRCTMLSFSRIGMPSMGDRSSPAARRTSDSLASARAASARRPSTALSDALVWSCRSIAPSISSVDEQVPLASASRCATRLVAPSSISALPRLILLEPKKRNSHVPVRSRPRGMGPCPARQCRLSAGFATRLRARWA